MDRVQACWGEHAEGTERCHGMGTPRPPPARDQGSHLPPGQDPLLRQQLAAAVPPLRRVQGAGCRLHHLPAVPWGREVSGASASPEGWVGGRCQPWF